MKIKSVLFALLAITAVVAFAACADVPEADVTTAPRETKGVNQIRSMAPTASPPPRTEEPKREDMQLAIVKNAKAKDNTVKLELYNLEGEEIVSTGETKTVNIDDNTYLLFGDIFSYRGLGNFKNKKVDSAYFYENATKKYESEPLYFFVQIDGDLLRYAELYFEHNLG
ncbi:MAG: hypothetical protein GX802_08510 [Clostridiales bacterium]|jgi:outer membrane lipoprotein-sorting protein|nr:hypothetical protein [Clostridiales bacterium]